MAVPSNPTLNALVVEGLAQAGESNPTAALIARATNEWVEEIKNDIWHLIKKPKVLHVTAYSVFNQGQSRYSYPADFSSDLSLMVLTGTATGIAQAGTNNSITLSALDNSGSTIIGKEILMTAGTSAGSYSQVVTYNSTTKLAGVIPDFATPPISGDSYMVIDVEYPIETRPDFNWETRDMKIVSPGLPSFAYPFGNDQEGYFVLNCPPDTTYGVRLRYYADITQTDTASTVMSAIYRRWRNVFIQGLKARKLNDEDDDRAEHEEDQYQQKLMNLKYEIYGMDLSNITDKVTDYQ